MNRIILFISCFIIIFLIYLLTVIIQTKKMDKFKNSNQVKYFTHKYGLKFKHITMKEFSVLISLTNSLIMSITVLVISYIPSFMWKLLFAFVLLVPLILIGYSILGTYISKKEGK